MNALSMLRRHGLALSVGLFFTVFTGVVFAENLEFVQPKALPPGANAPLTQPVIYPVQQTPSATPPLPTGQESSGAKGFAGSLSGGSMMMQSLMNPGGLPDAAGKTPTQFAVSNAGASTYTIPLWTAPGVGSAQLDLSLVYNSRSPNGVIGMGWSMAGLHAITRCNKTWAQDGAPGGVTLQRSTSYSDRFCLDGQQLKLTSAAGTYGYPNSTYATEIESFSKIAAGASSVGNGPDSFTVTTKNGLIYEYGTYASTTNSQIMAGGSGTIRTWALSRIRDRVGNYISFIYTNDTANGSYRIQEINYPYTASGQGPFYRVQFAYAARPTNDIPSGYIAGYATQETKQLTTVTMQWLNGGSWATTKTYNLTYTQNAISSRIQLTSVQECSTSSCFTATNISYQQGQSGWATSSTTSPDSTANTSLVLPLDLNGDGVTDLVYPKSGGSGYNWYVMWGSTSGSLGSPVSMGISTATTDALIPGDFAGRGQTDLLYPLSGTWYRLYWNGSTLASSSTGSAISQPQGSTASAAAADVNGDGLPDLIWPVNPTDHSGGKLFVQLNTSTGSSVSFAAAPSTPAYQLPGPGTDIYGQPTWWEFSPGRWATHWSASRSIQQADFNGDGKADLLAVALQKHFCSTCNPPISAGGFWAVLTSQGTTFTQSAMLNQVTTSSSPVLLDWNGDGCTDTASTHNISTWSIDISDCAGSFPIAVDTGLSIGTYPTLLVNDWDSDGRSDILYASGSSNWMVARSSGGSGITTVNSGINAGSNPWFVSDLNGDGLMDLTWVDQAASNTLKYNLHNGAFTPPDLATSFTDGFGMNQSPTYVPISKNNYSKYSGAVFPEQDYQGSLYVVNQFTASDGTGSTYQNQFYYYGARLHAQGRGFEGFYAQRIFDTRNSVYTYDYVAQSFPYTGMFYTRTTTLNFAQYLSYWAGSPSWVISGGSGFESRYFPRFWRTTDSQYESGGSKNGNLIKQTVTDYTYGDGYGNPTQIITSTTDHDSAAPASPFSGQTWTSTVTNTFNNDTSSNWCLGLPTAATVQNAAPGQTTQTRTYSYSVDSAHCRITQQVIEPSTAALMVTTNLGFDTCGNVNSVAVTGHNPDGSTMPTRTTSFNYSYSTSRCQLPERVTNALGQTSTIAYQYDFGVPTQATDPNGITVSWMIDDFGRKSRETRADGTFTNWDRLYCGAPPCWGVSDARFATLQYEYGSDSVTFNTRELMYDGFERLRYDVSNRVLGTWTYDRVIQYDALGRVITAYLPFASAPNGYSTFTYDILNRITAEKLYQPSGTLDRTTSIASAGRTTTITDPLNNVTTKIGDVMGQLRRVTDPSPGGTTYYDFDAFGNLNNTTDAIGKSSTATYNLRGFKTQMVDADQGTWNFSGNSLNELVGYTDAKSQSFGLAHDALGRMTSRTEPEGTSIWTWGTSAAAHNIGALQSVSGYGYSESLTYDSIGRLSNRAITSDTTYNYDFAYNSIGAVDTITYPTSPAPTGTSATRFKIKYGYSYGVAYQISDITQGSPAALWALTSANDYSSALTETLGANLISVGNTYRPWTNEITGITTGVSGSATNRQNLAYTWDVNGNLTQRQDLNQSLAEVFTPDALNRVASSTLNGISNLTVGYDASGNITSRSDVGSYTYGNSAHPHAVTAAGSNALTYDANGNVATKNSLTFNWASFNLPTYLQATVSGSTLTSTLSYGPEHQRYKQIGTYINGTETTYYVGGRFEKMSATSSGLTYYRHYVPTPSGLTIVVSRNSNNSTTTSYALSDHLGSTDAVLDGSGALSVQESFGAFGQRRLSNWSAGMPPLPDMAAIANSTRRGFTFHEMLDNVGLVHMNGRVYDPSIGRFLSVDPIVGNFHDSQSVNPYAYVGNRPLSFTDPTGYEFVCAFLCKTAITTAMNFLGFGSDPLPPPPPIVLPGMSGQGPATPCGPGGMSAGCNGQILYNGAPGSAGDGTTSSPKNKPEVPCDFCKPGSIPSDVPIDGTGFILDTLLGDAISILLTKLGCTGECQLAVALGLTVVNPTGAIKPKSLPKPPKVTNPDGRLGGEAHRATVSRRAGELEAEGHVIRRGGGRAPEKSVVTPEGKRRFPDITTRDPAGQPYHENVGRTTKSGDPVARERRALEDIEKATGTKPGYTPYDR